MHGRSGESCLSGSSRGKHGVSLGNLPLAPFEKIYVWDQGGMLGRRLPLIAPPITMFTFCRHTRVGTHLLADFLTSSEKKKKKKIRYNLREKRCRTGPRSVLGEDISILIITFTSDWLTVRQIKKVHLASINYIYLRLSLHEISALAKKISVIKSRARRMNTFLRQSDIS